MKARVSKETIGSPRDKRFVELIVGLGVSNTAVLRPTIPVIDPIANAESEGSRSQIRQLNASEPS